MQFKLTKKEKSWILYDVGNSAFVLMVSTILPVYFNYLAQNAGVSDVDYLAYWGYAASISTLIVAVLGPVMGTLADTRGFKKFMKSDNNVYNNYHNDNKRRNCPHHKGSSFSPFLSI